MTATGATFQHGIGRQILSKAQFAEVKRAVPAGVGFDVIPEGDTLAPDVAWQRGHILVSDAVDIVHHPELTKLGAKPAKNLDGTEQKTRPGFARLIEITGKTAAQAVTDLNKHDDLRGKVWRNYLMSICPVNVCPADEPIPNRSYPATLPVPAWDSTGNGGSSVRVRVIDTGLAMGWDENHPWLTQGPGEVSGDPNPTYNSEKEIELYAGHGEFIAGVLRCIAPRTQVHVSDELRFAGATTEFEIRNALLDALDGRPHLIVLSAGGTTVDGSPMQAMKEVVDRMRQPDCTTLLVAAAGNDGLGPYDDPARGKFWPAAFADDPNYEGFVVAVGALRQNREHRACFSNYGTWVSIYEDGERLVNAYPKGMYTYHEPIPMTPDDPSAPYCLYYDPTDLAYEVGCTCVTALAMGTHVVFEGMAFWSGTSFSTPIAAARIAKHMTETGRTDARDAWADLKSGIHVFHDTDGALLRKFP